jgi:hypothetical protein
MSENEYGHADRKRQSEEEYFRKKDLELVEKMRKAAAEARNLAELGEKTGVKDPAVIKELEEMGFTPANVSVLPLVPVVQMAWAEGGITPAERALLTRIARERGITEGSPADLLLTAWMTEQPSPAVFAKATRLIRAVLELRGTEYETVTADDLIKYCEAIASASGGVLGFGKISAEERATLEQVVSALKARP